MRNCPKDFLETESFASLIMELCLAYLFKVFQRYHCLHCFSLGVFPELIIFLWKIVTVFAVLEMVQFVQITQTGWIWFMYHLLQQRHSLDVLDQRWVKQIFVPILLMLVWRNLYVRACPPTGEIIFPKLVYEQGSLFTHCWLGLSPML